MSSDFFMQLSEALARNHITCLTEFTCLADVLEPELIQSCLDSRALPHSDGVNYPWMAMIWAVIGMALFRGESVRSLINKLDIVLPQDIDYVARSAVRLGCEMVREVFSPQRQYLARQS